MLNSTTKRLLLRYESIGRRDKSLSPSHLAKWLVLALLVCSGCRSVTPSASNAPLAANGTGAFERDLSIARLSERHDEVEKAKQIYKSILAQDATNQESLHRMGVIAAREGRMTDAMTYLESAMAADTPSAALLGDLGYIHYQQKQFHLAEDRLNEALDLDPRDERALNNLGLSLAAQKKYRQALSLFEQVGTPAEAFANLAYAQTQHGDLEAAEGNYHLALEADPQTKVAAVGLIELRKHMRLNQAREYRHPKAVIARSEPKARRTFIKNPKPSVVDSNTIASVSDPLPPTEIQEEIESVSASRAIVAPMATKTENLVTVAPPLLRRDQIRPVSHTEEIVEGNILNALPTPPAALEPVTLPSVASAQNPIAMVTQAAPAPAPAPTEPPATHVAQWPDSFGLTLAPVEQTLVPAIAETANQ